jgi:ketosteroid isomerase-like protein
MTSTPADVEILRGVLDPWKAAVDAHDPEGAAALFTEDALFQGLHPYTVGRQGVADYYASQPFGLTAEYRILETRRPASDFVYGYLSVDFAFTDGQPTLPVLIGVAAQRSGNHWTLALYQVSHRPGL